MRLFAGRIPAEVDGRYLHWEDLRRRKPPQGLTSEEWWLGVSFARGVLGTEVPLEDLHGRRFRFARTDALLIALHQIDREMGSSLELSEPHLATREGRNTYIVRSLMEEAITSSQLEGASTTRRVAKEMLLEGRRPRTPAERMIFNNFQAMELVRRRAGEAMTPRLLLEIHEEITRETLSPAEIGRWREADEPVVVQDHATGAILHTPPRAEELPARIEALCAFANERETGPFVHPVVRAITLHFMVAYNHPFVDGNGRTARVLFYWSMVRQKYWLAEFLSISRILRRAPAQYSRAFLLTETDEGDLTYFLLHQLEAIQEATRDLHAYLDRKSKELRGVEQRVRVKGSFNHRQRTLLAHALRDPSGVYAIEAYRREHGVVYQTARQDLLDLEKAGLLVKRQRGRSFLFVPAPDLTRRLEEEP